MRAMNLPEGFTLRGASLEDVNVLVSHRRAMFRDMGYSDKAALDRMAEKSKPWLIEKMRSGEYLAWPVMAPDDSVAAGADLWLMDWIPHMVGTSARRSNILNVYTDPEFRRRGLARRLMEVALRWCRDNGVDTVVLHASAEARALYESLAFTASNEMRIRL